MSEHTTYASAVKQVAGLQDRLARVRAGMCELQHEAAANTMSDTNGQALRAAYATFEARFKALAELCEG